MQLLFLFSILAYQIKKITKFKKMNKIQLESKSDLLGAFASGLCMIHCLATPLIFISKACFAVCCSAAPVWWQSIDYLFVLVSGFAIYHVSKNSNTRWVRIGLYVSWILLLFTVLMSSFFPLALPESFIYIPSLSIVALHLYNYRYCRCADDYCLNEAIG